MIFRDGNKLLRPAFECPEIDKKLCWVVRNAISDKETALAEVEIRTLAKSITETLEVLVAATDSGFILPKVVLVGNDDYSVLYSPITPENVDS